MTWPGNQAGVVRYVNTIIVVRVRPLFSYDIQYYVQNVGYLLNVWDCIGITLSGSYLFARWRTGICGIYEYTCTRSWESLFVDNSFQIYFHQIYSDLPPSYPVWNIFKSVMWYWFNVKNVNWEWLDNLDDHFTNC